MADGKKELTPEERAARADRFAWHPGDLVPVGICNGCKHLRADGCDAFPWGIPRPIRNGDVDHRHPVEGDNGIQFEPLE